MIQRAGAAHPAILAAIHATAFPPNEAWDTAMMAAQLTMPGVFAFVADASGMIIARRAADEAEILTLAVTPTERRRGTAQALVEAAANEARAHGALRMFLEVSVVNVAARALYRSSGFSQVGRRRRYYADGSDALVLARVLAAGATP
jgi:ribosomal-protein-alanine N-acetyltransferase